MILETETGIICLPLPENFHVFTYLLFVQRQLL